MIVSSVQTDDFSPAQECQILRETSAGALVSFLGCVREGSEKFPVTMLELQHYPGMTEPFLAKLGEQAHRRYGLLGLRIVHRVGTLVIGDNIVHVAATAPHRAEAFDAVRFVVETLKAEAPFWKKEIGPLGQRWVRALEPLPANLDSPADARHAP